MNLRTRFERLPLRIRLVLAATALLPVALGAVFGLVFLRFESAVTSSIDSDLRSRADTLTPLIRRSGPATIRSAGAQELLGPQGAFAQVLDARGRVLASTSDVAKVALLTPSQARHASKHGYVGEHSEIPFVAKRSRLVAVVVRRGRESVVIGRSLKGREGANESFGRALLIGGPLSLLLAAAVCYLAAARALKPVDEMRRRAEEISAHEYASRLPVPVANDEIGRLGHTLNAMLDRLESAHIQQRVLVQDASHELRTPLATLTAEIELALRQPDPSPTVREAMTAALDEARHVSRVADDLLVLAQLEENGVPISPELIDVGEAVHAAASRFAGAAEAADRAIDVRGGPIVARVDPMRLGQAVGNLIDNALRHGAGPITVTLGESADAFEITVRDEGPGIDPAITDTAFDRFVRGSTRATGSGLGLAIVAAIAHAHHGSVRIADDATIALRLPMNDDHGTL